jgi:hypothetical protein
MLANARYVSAETRRGTEDGSNDPKRKRQKIIRIEYNECML